MICDWLFEAETIAMAGFDPSDAVAFWDLTNQQDWHVCELRQRGTASRSWVAGRYSNQEASVHAFDRMVADRYASDPISAMRTVRERYDVLPPRLEGRSAPPGAAATYAATKGPAPTDGSDRATDRAADRAAARPGERPLIRGSGSAKRVEPYAPDRVRHADMNACRTAGASVAITTRQAFPARSSAARSSASDAAQCSVWAPKSPH